MSDEARFDVRESDDAQFYFVLIASNGEIVADSEMYRTRQGAERGIEAAKRANAATEPDAA